MMLFAEIDAGQLTVAGIALTLISGLTGWFLRVFVPSQQQATATAESRTAGFINTILETQNRILAARDAMISQLMADDKAEREKDRVARHDLALKFQTAIAETNKQHIMDAEKDRAAFETRNRSVEAAIMAQTQQLQVALANVCKYRAKE